MLHRDWDDDRHCAGCYDIFSSYRGKKEAERSNPIRYIIP